VSDPAALNRIRWRCRRGMLELDAWLARFLDRHLEALSAADLACFEELLDTEDDDLYGWMTGRENAPDRFQALVARIKSTKVSP
jgi:antitoxin CptB